MTARSERIQIATQIMSALIIDNRIAWTKDRECYDSSLEELAHQAVYATDILLRYLKEE